MSSFTKNDFIDAKIETIKEYTTYLIEISEYTDDAKETIENFKKKLEDDRSIITILDDDAMKFEDKFKRISSEIDDDMKILNEWYWGFLELTESKKKDMIERHKNFPWGKDIKKTFENLCWFRLVIKSYEKRYSKWNINAKRLLIAIWTDNFNLVLYYIAKGAAYQFPDVFINGSDKHYSPKRNFILKEAFDEARRLGSIEMVEYIWYIHPVPYAWLYNEYENKNKNDTKEVRMFIAQRLIEKEWHVEDEDISDFVNFLEEKDCLEKYKFLLEKDDKFDEEDYKKIYMFAYEQNDIDIAVRLIRDICISYGDECL
jgi:hypothetical protein